MAEEFSTKRIINLPDQQAYVNGDYVATDNATNGTKRFPVSGLVDAAMTGFASVYDATKTYAVGDFCVYGGAVYECTTAITTAEAWTAAHWKATTAGSEIANLKADLTAVNPSTSLKWTLGKSIDASGAPFNSSVCAITDEIECQDGDVFVCNNAQKDSGGKWFIGFLVMYTRANGVSTFVERRAFTESSNPTTIIPAGVNVCQLVFGRQSSSGVTLTNEDIATYSDYKIYRKGLSAKEARFPFGYAIQTSADTVACMKVTYTKSGSSIVYVLNDNSPSKYWYASFNCRGFDYQITNNPNYSTTYQASFTDGLSSAPNSIYQTVCLCINTSTKSLVWKNNKDLAPDDYVLQMFINGSSVTPWLMSTFENPSVINTHLIGYSSKAETLTSGIYKIFKKVGCIGDSWTAGYLDSGSRVYGRSDGYAWTDYMVFNGTEWVNGGYSGAMTSTYLTDEIISNGGGHLAIEAAGQCQAYIIGLGFNDSRPVSSGGLTLGTSADIGDTTKDTFYSWYARIVDWTMGLNDKAFIFCQTMYPPLNNGVTDFASRFAPYNAAIRDIVAYYQTGGNDKVRLLDLENRADLYASLGRGWDVNGSHHGCVGYAFLAECLKFVLGDELAAHPDLYHNIREIPYTT